MVDMNFANNIMLPCHALGELGFDVETEVLPRVTEDVVVFSPA